MKKAHVTIIAAMVLAGTASVSSAATINISAQQSAVTSTVVLWNLNEGSGTTTADAATIPGGANNGTITASTTWTTGKFGAGLNAVAGDSGYVSSSLGGASFSNQVSMSAWIRPTAIQDGDTSYVMGYHNGSGGNPFAFIRLNNGSYGGFGFKVFNGEGAWAQWNGSFGSTNVLDGNWHHVAATFDNGTVRAWLNGVNIGTVSTYAGWALEGGSPGFLFAGGSVPWDPGYTGVSYIGDFDEVQLSNTVDTYVIPEPSGFSLLLGGVGTLLLVRRRA
ncbi:MAG: PEP-CTERM sorting domain-containing protein [Verrucomicrobia bacterium]|nr:PEP-CTERM sorting domain-containing protein [Verrucomicrobiota bacterium]